MFLWANNCAQCAVPWIVQWKCQCERTTAFCNFFKNLPQKHNPNRSYHMKNVSLGRKSYLSMIVVGSRKTVFRYHLERDLRWPFVIQRKYTRISFDIEVKRVPFNMHGDTVLVVIDMPGINEVSSGSKYKDMLEKGRTFDCIVLVMDGTKGVNDEEQLKFRKSATHNVDAKKDLPIIILCNKIDDPKDEEQSVLVDESHKAVEHVFRVKNRSTAQDDKIKQRRRVLRTLTSVFPFFIATSAFSFTSRYQSCRCFNWKGLMQSSWKSLAARKWEIGTGMNAAKSCTMLLQISSSIKNDSRWPTSPSF